jgi:hypothetical protein
MKSADEYLSGICDQVLRSDKSIRFVGIPNKMGKLVISRYSYGLVPIITEQEIEILAIESVLRMNTRKDFESKFGRPIYSFTLYEKVNWSSRGADHDSIIMNKILPIIGEHVRH